jgi:hypothetical protein
MARQYANQSGLTDIYSLVPINLLYHDWSKLKKIAWIIIVVSNEDGINQLNYLAYLQAF